MDRVARAEVSAFPAVGLGTDVRVKGRGLAGGGLILDDRLVHLAAFRVAREAPASGLTRASRRQRLWVE